MCHYGLQWLLILKRLESSLKTDHDSVFTLSKDFQEPYHILIATIISSRTKDEIMYSAAIKIFKRAPNLSDLLTVPVEEIARLIYPVGFYRTKAANLMKLAKILFYEFNGKVPSSMVELLKLPGVGRKTANLVLGIGFGIPAICVDTHVHRIANRIGLVQTKDPEETEKTLMEIIPKKYWIIINKILVNYGQQICTSISPFCSICTVNKMCNKKGVINSR